jgi:hypothetical protein
MIPEMKTTKTIQDQSGEELAVVGKKRRAEFAHMISAQVVGCKKRRPSTIEGKR